MRRSPLLTPSAPVPELTPSRCLKCGAVLAENELGGLCPECVGRQMFGAESTVTLPGDAAPDCPAPASNAPAAGLAPGQMIGGRYRLSEKIGEGGFATVFRAEQMEPVRRQVALKVIKLGMDTRQVVARFELERQALALMNHPHIARVFDAGTTPAGRPYFVMELVHGSPLTTYCDRHCLSTPERLRLFITICQAVQHAHQKGIIHRDLKPSNVLVADEDTIKLEEGGSEDQRGWKAAAARDDDPRSSARSQPCPKVIDFGIAKATQTELTEQTVFTQLNQIVGTPAYMSPEQLAVSAADVDTRSDIYSLGVLLYELLTGKTPFDNQELLDGGLDEMHRIVRERNPLRPSTRLRALAAKELSALARRRRTEAPKLIHLLRGDLDWIVMKCLEKDRTRRYSTANGLARELERHLLSEPVIARPPSVAYRTRKFVRRNRLAVAAAAALLTTLLAGVILSSVGFLQANRERKRADQEARNVRIVSYGANLRSAIYLSDSVGNGGRAMQALSNCPVELRDWEWDFVRSRCDQTHQVIAQGLEDVRNAVFTPDGTKILSCRLNGLYQLWDFQSGRELARLQMKPVSADDYLLGLMIMNGPRFTPDGKRVALFDPSNIVVWNLAAGEPQQTFTNLHPMAVSVGSNELISLEWLDGEAVIRDLLANQLRASLKLPPKGTFGAEFSPDGRWLLVGGGAGTSFGDPTWIEFWDVAAGKRERRIMTSHFFLMSNVTRNGEHQLLATVSYDEYAKVFVLNASDGAGPAHAFNAGQGLYAVALSHKGRLLAAGGSRSDILIWDLSPIPSDAVPNRLLGHASSIVSVRFSPDDRWILSTSLDGSVRAWETEPYLKPGGLLMRRSVKDVVFCPDGKHLVSVGTDGAVRLWNAVTGEELATVGKPGVPIQEVAYNPDGSSLAMLERESGQVSLWDAVTWQRRRGMREAPRPVKRIAFAGAYLAGYGAGNRVCLWDAEDGTLKTEYSVDETNADARAAAFSTEGEFLAVSPADAPGEVRVYHLLTGKLRQVLRGPRSMINALAFSSNTTQVAAGFVDTTARVWDLASGRLLHGLRGHTEEVKTVAFSPSGQRLLTGSADDSLRIWKMDTEEELINLPVGGKGNIELIRFSPDGRTIVAITQFAEAFFFQSFLPPAKARKTRRLVDLASRTVSQLTRQLPSPEQVLEALRRDPQLDPDVKKMALEIIRRRTAARSERVQP